MHTAEELFLDSGPRPAEWWKLDPLPRGPNDETLAYAPRDVRLLAPLLNPARVGTDEDVRCGEAFVSELKLAAIIGKQGCGVRALEARQYIAGFTAMNDLGTRTALGPYLVTPDEIGNPYDLDAVVRVNGEERASRQFGEPSAEVRGGHRAPFVRRPDPSRRHHRVPSRPLPGDPPGRCHRAGDLEDRNAADARGLSCRPFAEGKGLLGFVSHTRLSQPGVFTNARERLGDHLRQGHFTSVVKERTSCIPLPA